MRIASRTIAALRPALQRSRRIPRPEIFSDTFGCAAIVSSAPAPAGERFGTAVGRQCGVVDDDRRARKVTRERGGFAHVPPWRLQVV
jgi:hypothetical protein